MNTHFSDHHARSAYLLSEYTSDSTPHYKCSAAMSELRSKLGAKEGQFTALCPDIRAFWGVDFVRFKRVFFRLSTRHVKVCRPAKKKKKVCNTGKKVNLYSSCWPLNCNRFYLCKNTTAARDDVCILTPRQWHHPKPWQTWGSECHDPWKNARSAALRPADTTCKCSNIVVYMLCEQKKSEI